MRKSEGRYAVTGRTGSEAQIQVGESSCQIDGTSNLEFPVSGRPLYGVNLDNCSSGNIPRKIAGDSSSLDFYDSCCEFGCPDGQPPTISAAGVRHCG